MTVHKIHYPTTSWPKSCALRALLCNAPHRTTTWAACVLSRLRCGSFLVPASTMGRPKCPDWYVQTYLPTLACPSHFLQRPFDPFPSAAAHGIPINAMREGPHQPSNPPPPQKKIFDVVAQLKLLLPLMYSLAQLGMKWLGYAVCRSGFMGPTAACLKKRTD